MKWLWVAAGALLFAGCSQSSQPAKTPQGTEGGLHVTLHPLGAGDVEEVHLDLEPDASEPDPAPAPIHVVLRPGDPGVGSGGTGQPVVWTWSEDKLPIGAYRISARAFDRTSPGPGVAPIFESGTVPTRIQVGSRAAVNLFLRQHWEDAPFDAPHVIAVRFDKAPALGDTSQITVWGEGGAGALSLSGSANGQLGRAASQTWDGKGFGDAKDPDGASIDWQPGAMGPDTLLLTLEDAELNRSSLAIAVNVGQASGAADFSFVFNHAPWAELRADATIKGSKVEVELEARYGDLESTQVDYEWDLSDCIGKGYAVDPDPYPYETLSGTLPADLQSPHVVTLEFAASPLPDPLPVCTIALQLSDDALPANPAAVSTSTRKLVVAPGKVDPTAVHLREAAQIVLRSQPISVAAGDPLPALLIELLDENGDLTSSSATVTLQLLGGSGNVPLQGYSPKMAMNGQVTFSGLSVETVGSYLIEVSAPGLPSINSDPFTISPAAAAQLVFVKQPASGLRGEVLPEVQVELRDAFGNLAPETDIPIDLALQGGSAVLTGGSALSVAGVASFPALSVDTAGPRYTLLATSGSLNPAESEPFAIVEGSSGSSDRLVFVQQPAGGAAGDDIGTILLEIRDAGDAVVSSFAEEVQLLIASGPAGAILSGPSRVSATNGTVTFSGLSLDRAGSYRLLASANGVIAAESELFSIQAGDPAHLVFQQGPSDVRSLDPMSPAIEVVVLDALGNVVPQSGIPITLAPDPTSPAGATLLGEQANTVDGVATFGALQIDKAGRYMLLASGAGLVSLPSTAFTVRPGDADELRFVQAPLSATAGETFSAAVEIRDAAGNLVTDSHTVGLQLLGGPGPLQGIASKASHAGRAEFDGLRIDAADSAYVLEAAIPGLQPVQSDPFPVLAGAPVGLAWIAQPQSVASQQNLGPVVVEIRDAWSNPVQGYTDDLEIKLAPSAPPGVSLLGAGTVTPVQGQATFSPLSIAKAGTNYQLLVQNLDLGPFASAYFDVEPGEPHQLVFLIQPHGNATGASLGEVTVGVTDEAGNLSDANGKLITLSLQGSRPEAQLDGTLQKLSVAGKAAFGDLSVDKVANGYTLRAEADGLVPATSAPFDINAGLCPTGYDSCDGACVDLQTNTAHCGACDNDCGGFACVDGACDFFCGDGLTDCGGSCVDVDFDAAHCGGCGQPCAEGEICVDGSCTAPFNREWATWPPPNDAPTHYVSSDHMVEDTVTGLIWQRNVLAGGTFTWEGAQDYCRRLRVAGRDDWRVPTVIELISLLDLRGPAHYINQGAFANTPNTEFWSRTEVAKNPGSGWYVGFDDGVVGNSSKGGLRAVRCVRGGLAPSGPHYEESPDGLTIKDNWTGLTWVKAADPTTRSQADAAAYCESLVLGGYDDWRLPTRKELESLIDRSRSEPAIAPTFPGVGSNWYYWTDSPHPLDSTSSYWRIYFTYGVAGTQSATSSYYTRCVRDDRPEAIACGTTRTLCAGVCVDVQDDPTNCGACNNTCGKYEVCATGICQPAEDFDWANWPLPPEAPNDYVINGGTVTDTVTGLMWERFAVNATFSWEDAHTYCRNLGTGGFGDWRVPSQAELLTLVNENATNPAINALVFPDTASAAHWSATQVAGSTSSAWYVDFAAGGTSYTSVSNAYRVRCVRNGDPFTGTRYDIGEETVRDLKTKLVWQRHATGGSFSWENAAAYCGQLRIGGYDTWRLPTKKELESLVDRRVTSGPTIYALAFPNTPSGTSSYFLTATPSWRVRFDNGRTYASSGSGHVRCVRDDTATPLVCSGALSPCDGGCTDFQTDAANCGACGNACAAGQMCADGACVEAPDREMANWRLPPEVPTDYQYDAETVTDLVTGLVWQRNIVPTASFTWEDAEAYCRHLRIDDKADWRLPTTIELLTLISTDLSGPAIFKALFGSDGSGRFWTASPSLGNSSNAWYVDMTEGDSGETGRANPYFVRCVRAGHLPPAGPRYQVVADGVIDQFTQLLWQADHSSNSMNRDLAAQYCAELEPAGSWRLPTKKELESLVDRRRADPSLDENFFPGTIAGYFWTGTQSIASASYNWRVQFTRGASSDLSSSSYVRCVQDLAPPPTGCLGGLIDCNGACVDALSDPDHCGACDNACNPGELCAAGACAAPPDPMQDFDQPNWPLPPEAPLHYVVTAETVTDPVTGLMWERVIEPGTMIGSAAATHCDGRNTGGYTDWRLPSLAELLTLVNSNAKSPAINTAAFPGTPSGRFWSSVLSGSNRWWLDFSSGSTGRNSNTSTSYVSNVRCVRGGSLFAEPRFQVDDESVTDLKTGLSWQRETLASTLTLADARNYCAQLGAGGFQDWRLPTKKELESLVDRNNSSPSIDSSSFPGTQSSTYWTATMEAGSSTNAWQVSFSTGASSTSSSASYVRCVRDPDAAPPICRDGLNACGGGCTDLLSDAANCGSCDNACAADAFCLEGNCVAAPDREWATWPLPPEVPSDYTVASETVTDPITELVWQRNFPESVMTRDAALAYCRSLRLEGKADWRLPTLIELLSLVSTDVSNPAINTWAFGSAGTGIFWSASPHPTSSTSGWYLDFASGATSTQSLSTASKVRCVRGGKLPSGPRYDDSNPGTVLDNETGLLWQQTATSTTFSHADAVQYCKTLGTAGYSDWRLPTKKELESLVYRGKANPSIDENFFANTGTGYYWTSTPSGSSFWRVRFNQGASDTTGAGSSHNVRCVRDPVPQITCSSGFTLCGDACVDPQTDPSHCGGCNAAVCGAGEICHQGVCIDEVDRDLLRWPVLGEVREDEDFVVDVEAGTVEDLWTGLTWQRDVLEAGMTQQAAIDYCRNLKLGGRADWRLPSIVELLSLVDQSQVNPPFNPVAFSNASPATNFSYWSSTQVSNSSSSAWTLTPSGSIHSQSKTSTSYTSGSTSYTFYARCVRGGAVDPPAGLTVLSESVIDEATGLQWEREPLQLGMNHRDALAYCATLGKEGHDDWRLPTKKELESLLIWSKANPALDDSIAGDGEKTFTSANSNYWTSSLQQGVGPNAWYVSFSNGSMGIQGTGSSSYVRCVRDAGAAPSDCGDLTLHGDICVDPDTDPNHCGPGFVACDEGEICSGGSCVQAPDRDRVRWSVPGETRALEEFLIDEEEGTVEDLRTGLTWQRSAIEVRMTLDQATTYCRNLKIGGRADWRLPSITELLSLVEQSRQSPALNLSLFPEASTSSNYTYRSATEVQNSSGNTWALTSTGEIVSQSKTSTSSGSGSSLRYYYARCVRGGPDDNGASLLFGGETVSDPETGLQWQRNALPAFTASQPEALAYCENLDLDGFSDWRLPTKKELESIVDWKESGPAWAQAFTGSSTAYWTASAWLQNPNSSRWYVHFSSGNSGYTSPSSSYAVRCVRDAVVSTPSCGELDRCFDQICVDLQTDPRFCGNCLNACEEGEVCEGGTCVMAPDFNRARWVAPEEAPQASDYDTETYEGIVIDLRTQLHWQRDIYASFRMNHAAAVQYCRQLRLHGFSDWRLPTIIELLSLVDQSVQNPALNRDVFPDPLGRNGYWSNTEYENGKTNVWVLRPTGETATQSKTSVSSGSGSSLVTYFARCVRGGPASDVQPYTVEAETVWDPNTHLMWERAAPTGTFTLANAEGRCDTLNANAHGGYTDWRLPTKKELESLIHWNAYNPVFDAAFSGRNGTVWTSSPWVGSPASYRWQPNFSSGTVGYSSSSSGSRCVRSHPPPGP